jgi:hypothetical protein
MKFHLANIILLCLVAPALAIFMVYEPKGYSFGEIFNFSFLSLVTFSGSVIIGFISMLLHTTKNRITESKVDFSLLTFLMVVALSILYSSIILNIFTYT